VPTTGRPIGPGARPTSRTESAYAKGETEYWLEIIGESKMLSWRQIKADYEECGELLAIFTSIGRKL